MKREQMKRMLPRLLLMGVLAVLLLIAVLLKTPCLFRSFTGVPCPACGMSRAWLAAFRLDIAGACRLHPMFWGIPVLGVLYIFDGFPIPGKHCTRLLYLVLLAGFVLTYWIRLMLFFGGSIAI